MFRYAQDHRGQVRHRAGRGRGRGRGGYDLDGLRPADHPAADAADIARRLHLGYPVTGPWRMAGTVVRQQVYDDRSDYGRLAQAIEANSELLNLRFPFLPDDAWKEPHRRRRGP